MVTKLMLTQGQIAHYKEKGFSILKSGQYKGWLSSKWFRDHMGPVILTCPLCGGIVGAQKSYLGQQPCAHVWTRDHAGFRYRWVIPVEG